MTDRSELLTLLILIMVSVIGPLVAVPLRMPAAVVLILAGVGLGRSGVGWIDETPTVVFLSNFGFLLLMFIAGMEIDFEAIRMAGRRALLEPLVELLAVFALAISTGWLLEMRYIEVLAVSVTSVGMPLIVLQESGRLHTPLGRHVMLAASLGEFLSIVAIVAFEVFVEEGGISPSLVLHLLKLALLFVGSAYLIRWARALVWWYPEPFRRIVEHHDVAELGVRTGLLVMLAFVVLMSIAGVEAILGAFIAGALVAFVWREKHALEGKVSALGHGLFIPIFFVVVGVRFDLRLLDAGAMARALLLVAVAGAVKLLPSLVLSPKSLTLLDRMSAGLVLAAPLTLVVAIAEVGTRLGLIGPAQHAGLVLVGLILSIVFPALFRLVVRGSDRGAAA